MNFIWILIFTNTNIIELEKNKMIKSNYQLNDFFVFFLCICAIFSILIAFPRLPFVKVADISGRFSALLPGNAWNHITIVCLILLIPSFKKNKLTKLTYLFCIFWFLSHYERVDIIGLLFGLFVITFFKKNRKINCWYGYHWRN